MKTSLKDTYPNLPVTEARERLADVITRVGAANDWVVITRHGKPVAGIVGMGLLHRLPRVEEQDYRVASGWFPAGLLKWGGKYLSRGEAAVRLRQVQLDRLAERRVIEGGGLEVIPGGELDAAVTEDVPEPRRRGWWSWRQAGF